MRKVRFLLLKLMMQDQLEMFLVQGKNVSKNCGTKSFSLYFHHSYCCLRILKTIPFSLLPEVPCAH